MMSGSSIGHAVEPRGTYRWVVAGILMLIYASGFIDRQLLSLVIEPIRHDLKITDTQVGLLVWTIMTAGCGLVGSYWPLFAMRAGVGSGEAALSPSAYSLLSDYFPKAQLARALSVYGLGVPIGSSIAMIGGGWLIAAFNHLGIVQLAGFGTFRPWQMVFLTVALPGIPLALLVMLIREPARSTTDVNQVSLSAVCRHIWAHRSIPADLIGNRLHGRGRLRCRLLATCHSAAGARLQCS
jgi:MFS family permease